MADYPKSGSASGANPFRVNIDETQIPYRAEAFGPSETGSKFEVKNGDTVVASMTASDYTNWVNGPTT
ncbi:MAG: hypothetical protein HUJ98_07245 [Bacteroidaceae bacterium]|nr:hypothetical protein [Bacteroidaceae bacterium]